jgi:hypothetical protein
MKHPSVVDLIREGAALSALQAVAAKLWLDAGGADPDGAVARGIEAYWRSQPGADPYWDCLSRRMNCDACGETSRLENLAICPDCFKVFCYKHGSVCVCGCATLG